MEFIMPSWLFQTILIAYFLLLVALTYMLIKQKAGLLMLLVLWFIPIIGPVIVWFSRKRQPTKNRKAL